MGCAAPTPAEILAGDHSFGIFCAKCRVLREPEKLAERLVAAGRADTPVDQLRFRCETCGAPGEPWIRSGDNRLEGDQRRLWPPRPAG